uniref:Uncharacterized protein LOC111102827 n=1 Tax=Crassostrea virginica TaxID=6565 RepID=A0A8B8ALE2_CRAVI|nr:uncharacterized protein LOC111102827 [Crassostrea virginica]XP_022291424.1 uncharacterized protein LOC111102827 [Crassostrea virginica]
MVGMEDRPPVLWIAGVFVLCLTKCVLCQEIPQGVPTEGAPGTSPGSGLENSPQSDPCSNTFEHALLKDDGFRSPACRRSQSDPLCDDTLVEDWYLLQPSDGSSYLRIHRECPTIGTCGTEKPIWMNGTYPAVSDGEVLRQMCVRTAFSCCQDSFQVKVKNCSAFLTFKLKPVPKCNQRYCFDRKQCNPPTDTPPISNLGVLANQSQELLPGDNTCPNGTFRDSNNNASEANRRNPCQSCPLGFFCVHGNRIKCPVGHYCPPGSSQALACPPGNYCPRGQFYPVQCSAGSYNPSNTSINNSACLSCPPGLYCFMPGLNKPTGPCLPGFYCTGRGSSTPTPVDGVMGNMCPPGKYCPRGAAEPLPCPEGYYNPYTAREACDACPQNLTCPVGSVYPFECDPENESVNVQCTLQTEGPTTANPCINQDGSQRYGNCEECPPGNLCGNGFNIRCPAGYFCPNGTSVFICPKGYYCPAGQVKPIPCEIGTFNPSQGNGTKKACVKCSPGLYCRGEALSVPTGPCSPGFYCDGGSITPQPLNGYGGDICPAGHFCPEGTGLYTQCSVSTYNPSRGQSSVTACLTCPKWATCDVRGLALPTECSSNNTDLTEASRGNCSALDGDFCTNDTMCLNGGKCIFHQEKRGFCECLPHYEGNFCEVDTTLLFLLDNSTLSYMTLEEEEVVMEIVLGTSFVHSDVEIVWYRNNLQVRNSSRIQVTVEREERAFRLYTTRLYVTSARTDDGNGSLAVVAAITQLGVNITVNVSLEVLALPLVSVSPLSLSVQTGEDLVLRCDVQGLNPRNSTAYLEWFKNKDILSSGQGNELTLTIPETQKRHTGHYVCQLSYSILGVNGSRKAASNVYVYSPDDLRCKETVDENGLRWETGVAGVVYYALCPEGHVGNASKLCRNNGQWDRTVTINCVDKTIAEADQELDNIISDNIVDTTFVSSVVNEQMAALRNWTAQQTGTSGDVDRTVGLLDKILQVTEAANSKLPDQDFANVFDNVLSESQTQNWKEINQQTKDGSSRILSTVEKFGNQMSKDLTQGEYKNYHARNYFMTVGRGSAREEVTFPETPSAGSSSLVLPVQSDPNKIDIVYSATAYNTMYKFLPSENKLSGNRSTDQYYVNSDVLSMDIVDKRERTQLNPGIKLNLKHKEETNLEKTEVVCVFWNFTLGSWSSEGCNTTKVNNHVTQCQCNHLTNFAILMRPYNQETEDGLLSLISLIGCSITVVLSVITFVIFIILWRYVKNDQNLVLVHLCLSISLAYLLFLVGVTRTENKVVCTVIAAFLQYFFLVEFFLMLAMGVYYFLQITVLYYSFSTANDIKARLNMKRLLPIAWGIPILITCITLGATYQRGYNQQHVCWLSTESGALYGFVGPVLLIICINLFIICSLFRVMCATRLLTESNTKRKATTGLRSLCTLLPVLGITWVFGILSINEDLIVFQYLFAIFNSLQGLFIFLPNCVLNKKVREGLLHKLRLFESQQENSKIQTKNSKRLSNALDNMKKVKIDKEKEAHKAKNSIPPVRLIKYTKEIDFIDGGGHDNVCFDAMTPLDGVHLRSSTLSDSTIRTSETNLQSKSDENGFYNIDLNDQNRL